MPTCGPCEKEKHNSPEPHTKDRSTVLPWLILAFGAIVWGLIIYRTRFQLEDALITYRYSSNIIAGKGFVFNPGERVLGTTTPLVTLFLALVSLPFGSHAVREVATVVMPVFGLMAGVAAYFALTKRGVSVAAAGLAMLFLYTHYAFIRTGIGGMETPVVLLLMSLSLWALGGNRSIVMGVLCGLIVLCRIDGSIWATIMMLALGLKSWRKAAVSMVAAFLVVLPWIVFATIYFGNFLPNSMLAKAVVRPGRENILLTGRNMLAYALWYARGTGFRASMYLFPLWLAVGSLGARRLLRQSPKDLWPVVAFPFIYALTMYAGRSPRFEWYLLPITYTCMIMLAVGVIEIYRVVDRLIPPRARTPVAASIITATLLYYCGVSVPTMIRHMSPMATGEDYVRTQVGKWLKNNTPSQASVAMEAIGYQGYYSKRRIIDFPGLVTPKVIEFKRSTAQNGRVFDNVLRFFRPDYIVLRSYEVDTNHHFNGGPLFLTPEKKRLFAETYHEVKRFSAPGSRPDDVLEHLTVYRRIPISGG